MRLERVTPRIWRGSRPETEADFALLKTYGIRNVISLDGENNILDPKASVVVENWSQILPPSQNDLNRILDLLLVQRPTFIHCKAGVDRTGMVVAWYRIKVQSWGVDAAIAEMWEKGMHPWYILWPLFIRWYCK